MPKNTKFPLAILEKIRYFEVTKTIKQAVLREQKIPFEVRANSFDENIYQKLKEVYKLEFLPIAKRDMDDIIYYISNTLNNKKAASALAQSFINSANSILNFP